MRILHTVERYSPDNGGGAEAVVRRVSEGLAARGHEVTVATSFSRRRSTFAVNGVRIAQFRVRGVLGHAVFGIVGEKNEYLDFLRKGSFDIVMNYAAQTWHSDLTFQALGSLSAKTVLAACGYSGLLWPRSLLYRRYFKRLPGVLQKYDAVVYHSAQYQDKHFGDSHGVGRYAVIPNGVDTSEFQQEGISFRQQYGVRTKYMILTVGNHFRSKGHAAVIEAFRELGRRDTTLVIVGRDVAMRCGSCWASCRRWARRQGASILLLADAPRAHVIAAYRAADVFVSGSSVEAFPLVILESMAAGVPYVAFPAGNIHELPGGALVRSTTEMSRVVNELLDDEKTRRELGARGRDAQRARYEWDIIVDQYEQLYRELVAGRFRSGERAGAIVGQPTPG